MCHLCLPHAGQMLIDHFGHNRTHTGCEGLSFGGTAEFPRGHMGSEGMMSG